MAMDMGDERAREKEKEEEEKEEEEEEERERRAWSEVGAARRRRGRSTHR